MPIGLAMLVLLVSAVPAAAQSEATLAAAAETVLRQLAAFRADDWDGAYAFASTSIRTLFDRQAFEGMVRSGYPEIARSTTASVTDGEEAPDGTLYLVVVVRGANGRAVEALYEMVRETAGWRVNGVVTLAARPSI